jgi:hypothetical protein
MGDFPYWLDKSLLRKKVLNAREVRKIDTILNKLHDLATDNEARTGDSEVAIILRDLADRLSRVRDKRREYIED